MIVLGAAICALIVFSIWRRSNAIPENVVLKPLTPPLTADRREILAQLRAGDFDSLDRTLASYESRAESDPAYEANAHLGFEAFSSNDPALDEPLSQWTAKSPRSYVAHLARAEFLFHQGWNARGSAGVDYTPPARLERMNAFFAQGAKEVHAAIALNPRVSEAYQLLVQQQRNNGPKDCIEVAKDGLREVPASFTIRAQVMTCLQPRWGGSYRAMEQFAIAGQKYAGRNPRLRSLKGLADSDRGESMWNVGNYAAAIASFNRAIAVGGDNGLFYRQRGEALSDARRFDEAIADLRRADQLWPQDPETMEYLAYALSETGDKHGALDKLNLALEVGGPRPYAERLRSEIALQLGSVTEHKKAVGD